MRKTLFGIIGLFLSISILHAQTDTMYIMKAGVVINKQSLKPTDVDSIVFYKPIVVNPFLSETVLIPAGTFTMGSPETEVGRNVSEIQHEVTLSAFRMSKFEITNAQFAAFLNAKSIGSDALYPAGAYPTQILVFTNQENRKWGVRYNGTQWIPETGFENTPVIYVTWYGASEFATYVGGTLPTEAQWEYACRAGTTTPFNTGEFLTNLHANFNWSVPYNGGINTVTTSPGMVQAVGSYPPNAFGLYDMHGNVWEWTADWSGAYPTTPQTNPKGPDTGTYRIIRGCGWFLDAMYCRSALRGGTYPNAYSSYGGFRVAFLP